MKYLGNILLVVLVAIGGALYASVKDYKDEILKNKEEIIRNRQELLKNRLYGDSIMVRLDTILMLKKKITG